LFLLYTCHQKWWIPCYWSLLLHLPSEVMLPHWSLLPTSMHVYRGKSKQRALNVPGASQRCSQVVGFWSAVLSGSYISFWNEKLKTTRSARRVTSFKAHALAWAGAREIAPEVLSECRPPWQAVGPDGKGSEKNGFKSPIRAGSLVNMGYKMILSYIKL
jgi:hypothetical protein